MSKAQQAGIPLRTHVPWAGGTNGRSTVDDHRRPRQRHLPDVRVGQHRARKSQERAARSKSSLRNLSAPPHVQVVRSPAWSSPDDVLFAGKVRSGDAHSAGHLRRRRRLRGPGRVPGQRAAETSSAPSAAAAATGGLQRPRDPARQLRASAWRKRPTVSSADWICMQYGRDGPRR